MGVLLYGSRVDGRSIYMEDSALDFEFLRFSTSAKVPFSYSSTNTRSYSDSVLGNGSSAT